MADNQKKAKTKKASGRKGKNRGSSKKIIKMVFALVVLAVLMFGVIWVVQSIQKQMLAARVVPVTVGGELGGDGTGDGQFQEPWGLAFDAQGNLFASDFGNGRVQEFGPDGKFIAAIGSKGDEKEKKPGTFNQPSGLYVDPQGFLYVCDTFFHRIQKFDSKGNFVKEWNHSFFGPRGIAGDGHGRIYVADTGNHQVQVFDADGKFMGAWGPGGPGEKEGRFHEPDGVVVGPDGSVYVADTENRRIQKFTPSGKFVAAFNIPTWKGKNAEVPYLAFYGGALYTTNASENSVLKVDAVSGKVLAMYKKKDRMKDGGFDYCTGIAVDNSGRVWVAERSVNKVAWFFPPQAQAAGR